jgi:hypothetical protein
MTHDEAQKFIEDQRGPLEELGRKIKEIDTVKGVTTVKDFQARQGAIRIIEEWLGELWGISKAEEIYPKDDDNIVRRLDNSQEF